jgi:hypothetical protein
MGTFDYLAGKLPAGALSSDDVVRTLTKPAGLANESLDAALARFHAAERQLDTAREYCRAAARRENKKISKLFAEAGSVFIARETGERWCDEIREEMRAKIEAARAEGFREGEARGREQINASTAHIEEHATLAQKIVLAGERRRAERPMAPDVIVREPLKGKKVTDPAALAQQIVEAGKKARRPRGE